MTNKIFVMLFTMLLTFASQNIYSAERAKAAYPELLTEENILAKPYSTIAPYVLLDQNELGVAAAAPVRKVDYYPTIFYSEYFYRDNDKQPIRDYRYYNVKSFVPDRSAMKQGPIRDFRKDMWVSR